MHGRTGTANLPLHGGKAPAWRSGGMMRRALALLLSSYLLIWIPVSFAMELMSAWSSIGMRGYPAVVELSAHGLAAILAATAGRMLRSRGPAASRVAAVAVVAAGLVSIQSLFWTVLPRQTQPGAELPLAAVAVAVSLLGLLILRVQPAECRMAGAREPA